MVEASIPWTQRGRLAAELAAVMRHVLDPRFLRDQEISIVWQFEGGVPSQDPLEALGSAETHHLVSPVSIDLGDELDGFARWCALKVAHRWDAPGVVLEWLSTGNENLRQPAHHAIKQAIEAGDVAKTGTTQRVAIGQMPIRNSLLSIQLEAIVPEPFSDEFLRTSTLAECIQERLRLNEVAVRGERLLLASQLITQLAPLIAPLSAELQTRLTQDRADRFDNNPLRTLRLGQWWLDGGQGLELIEY